MKHFVDISTIERPSTLALRGPQVLGIYNQLKADGVEPEFLSSLAGFFVSAPGKNAPFPLRSNSVWCVNVRSAGLKLDPPMAFDLLGGSYAPKIKGEAAFAYVIREQTDEWDQHVYLLGTYAPANAIPGKSAGFPIHALLIVECDRTLHEETEPMPLLIGLSQTYDETAYGFAFSQLHAYSRDNEWQLGEVTGLGGLRPILAQIAIQEPEFPRRQDVNRATPDERREAGRARRTGVSTPAISIARPTTLVGANPNASRNGAAPPVPAYRDPMVD